MQAVNPTRGYETFSTQCVPSSARVTYWNELTCGTFTGVAVDPVSPPEFAARLNRLTICDLSLAQVWSAGSTVRHSESHVRHLREEPHMLLHLQVAGCSVNSQHGRSAHLQPGDFTLCDTARPYTLSFNHDAQFLIGRLPIPALRQRLRDAEDLVGVRIPGRTPTANIMSSFLGTVMAQAGNDSHANWYDGAASVALDLIAMGIRAHTGTSRSIPHQVRRHGQVLGYIEKRICDPALSVQTVAAEFGVSTRSIQKIFAARGTTLGAHILEQRLKLAAKRLEAGSFSSVTELALSAGFNDLTHFGRSFRKLFGVSPRDYRHGIAKFRS
jgi:AraC-like DNA-binding protein